MTPSCFKRKIDPKKHITFNGYFQLAYLHPNYFKPDTMVLDDLGLSKDDKFILMRLVSWDASHDIGQYGISKMKSEYISKLEQYGKVFISSESKLEKELEEYKLKIIPEKLHSLLSYAQLYIGEGGAMATEAGILGVPSVYVSSLVGTMGNFDELEKRYGLVYSFQDSQLALDKALELLEYENTKKKWQKKKERLLDENIDVTKFMTDFIEGYPESFENYKQRCVV
jgi:predicted glycosyltransferase